jgi:hypothetical protein
MSALRLRTVSLAGALALVLAALVPESARAAVPAPAPVDTSPWLVGAILCPLWEGGAPWRRITPFPEREPHLGYYDEGHPEVTDWEIKWAVDHGISFFLVCWYRAKDNAGVPVRPGLEHWLRRGLFESRHQHAVKFALLFENGNRHFHGQTSETDLLENLFPFWLENYFRRTNYLVLDGKPLLAIYNVDHFVRDLGGEAGARVAIGRLRAAAERAGFQGLYLLGQYCWGGPAELRRQAGLIQRIGLDASFAYHWPTFTGAFGDTLRPAGAAVIAAQETLWRAQSPPNVLTLSMGWDSAPWGFSQTRIQWRLAPAEFRDLAERAKALLRERDAATLAGRLVLLDNWNEYGEGHYLMPTREHGFGYLAAVRGAFAPHAPARTNVVPTDLGLGPYDAQYRAWKARTEAGK